MASAFRIVKATLVETAFSGEGARRYGGRWNSPGTEVVYAAQAESLAMLELLVHLQASDLLLAYVTVRVDFDDSLVEALPANALPVRWRASPAPSVLQAEGDRWARERRSPVLRVPSALVPRESNYLLNPNHPELARIVVGEPERCDFDPRLK
jgi:RES domain-containing protein